MDALIDLVREAFVAAIVLALPLFVAALAAATVAGFVAARFGLQDPALGTVARAIAVVVTLVVIGGTLGADARRIGEDAFGRIAAIGRGEADAP
jgi:type III secretory pathway component EscS